MNVLDNYMFRFLLVIFRLSSRELKVLLYIYIYIYIERERERERESRTCYIYIVGPKVLLKTT